MTSLHIMNIPLSRQLLLFFISSIFHFNHLSCGAEAESIKYSHGPLVSSLNVRSLEYGTPTKVAASSSGVFEEDATNTDFGTTANNAASSTAAALESPTDTGGEIVVPKTFPLSAQEPTCEQLRAMWIFSKRQSRAAEITNEIPTYRDPFAYNVWEPYYSTTRNMGGGVRILPRYNDRSRSPVFGRVISREPIMPQRVNIGQHQRHYGVDGSNFGGSSSRIYGAETKGTPSYHGAGGSSRRPLKYRHVGSNNAATNAGNGGSPNSVNVQGSFQRLKELIWTERAKELTQQRRAEELAARAAVLKEITNGQNVQSSYKHTSKSESPLMDVNRSPDRDIYQYLNDDRMSIATGQARYIDNNYGNKKKSNTYLSSSSNNGNNKRKNAKTNYKGNGRIGNSKDGVKEVGSYVATGGAGTSSMRSSMITMPTGSSGSSATIAHSSSYFDDDQSIGIPRTYPMRSSHFRERNRALLREDNPMERNSDISFSRKIRTKLQPEMSNKKTTLLERFIKDLNMHYYSPSNASEYLQEDKFFKDGTESENISETEDLFSSEATKYILPSSVSAVYNINAGKRLDTFGISEQSATKIQGWDRQNNPEVSGFLNFVNQKLLQPSQVTSDAVGLYDYFYIY
ncbi:signal transducer and activator of transcription B isoform X3 [Bactrocera dorsalis]|uniref:Signal transducer and activator of transcription B isoform X3 n=1 Tax=Bactrocera dorsalis TaxID=27457 RepID=A0ABM3K4M0_BACDO|nr:signal transducer and activator of transcription B isoform X3 [Bactrocera dorsalis]